MHLTRAESVKLLPIPRKGTKYLAVPTSHKNDSVSVVMAIRDMLKLARTAAEVKLMIHKKQLKLNGRDVRDIKESIKLFNVIHADKSYVLSISKNGKFSLHETKDKDRLCKLVGKKTMPKKKTQLHFHDGTTLLSEDKIKIGDSVYLDSSNKIKKVVSLSSGKRCIIVSGKYIGQSGKVESVTDKIVSVSLNEKTVNLKERSVFVE